jgi:hypothetical protein
MKAYIVHGWDGNPDEPVLKWLRLELEKLDWEVVAPAMPNPETPTIESWLQKLKEIIGSPSEDTILVGHSVGCQAVLRYTETLPEETRIRGLVLLAPWMELDQQTIKEEGEEVIEIARPWMETPIDFEKVKRLVGRSVAIFSDNDPFVPIAQAEVFKNKLDAEIIIEHGMGHFSPSDEVSELPSLLKKILEF